VNTRADVGCPVERAVDVAELVRALRIEFVTDVADLHGEWRRVGSLSITSGRCVAADPFCMHSDRYWHELSAPNGTHDVEVYYDDWDQLRIRLVFSEPLTRPQWGAD